MIMELDLRIFRNLAGSRHERSTVVPDRVSKSIVIKGRDSA